MCCDSGRKRSADAASDGNDPGRGRAGAATTLAVLNARGHSRRLTAAIVPLALLLSLGTVQSGVHGTLREAASRQLAAVIRADLVGVPGAHAAPPTDLATSPGVTRTSTETAVPLFIAIDEPDQDLPGLDGLNWERTQATALSSPDELLDPSVTNGSLHRLAEPGTIALSEDLLALSGTGVGNTVRVRLSGGETQRRTVVAVYDRGLGAGDALLGPADARDAAPTAVLLQAAPGQDAAVREAAERLGYRVQSRTAFLHNASEAPDGEHRSR